MSARQLIPIREWSEDQLRKGVSKNKQSYLLGFDDDAAIYRYLREPNHVMVDPVTRELWRKSKRRK